MKRRLLIVWLAALSAFLLALVVIPVRAQIPEPIPTLSPILPPTSSPSPTPSPTSSSEQPGEPPRTTSQPPQPPPSSVQSPPPSSSGGGSLPILVIPDIKRTPARTTAKLLEIMAPLTARGFPLERAMILTSAPFPVAGFSSYSDDFMFPRYTPLPHLHEGNDIFADFGTPIVASGPGVIAAMANTSIGGIAMWVAGDDGMSFYYSHLISFAEGLQPGQHVDTGTVLGYVGNTGNAFTTAPHVHFEVHPPVKDRRGRITASGVDVLPSGIGQTRTPPANPKPYLDAWLIEAEIRAQAFVQQLAPRLNALSRQIHFSGRVDDLFPAGSTGRPGDLVMLSALDPGFGPIGLAHQGAVETGLSSSGGSVAERAEAQQRAAAVRIALEAVDVKLAALIGVIKFAPQN